MKLVECNIDEVFVSKKKWNVLEIIDQFLDSGMKCARVDYEGHYKYSWSGTCSFNRAIERYHKIGVRAKTINDELYLIREERTSVN